MLSCPNCQAENEDTSRHCRECGKELSARDFATNVNPSSGGANAGPEGVAATMPAGAPAARRAAAACPSCGQVASGAADFCSKCGARLDGAELASFGRRFGGYLIDAVILLVITGIPAAIVSAIIVSSAPNIAFTQEQLQEQEDASRNAVIFSSLISLAIGLAYVVLLNASGGTWGKRILGMRLESSDTGDNIGFGRAIVRYIVAIGSGLALALGYLWCLWDDNRQTWHDKAAGSVVVRT